MTSIHVTAALTASLHPDDLEVVEKASFYQCLLRARVEVTSILVHSAWTGPRNEGASPLFTTAVHCDPEADVKEHDTNPFTWTREQTLNSLMDSFNARFGGDGSLRPPAWVRYDAAEDWESDLLSCIKSRMLRQYMNNNSDGYRRAIGFYTAAYAKAKHAAKQQPSKFSCC